MNLKYDPEIDPPATIAVIGGGPIGIEAALYGRFLGYSMLVLDSAKVGHSLACWNDWPMPGSWNEVTTPLGMAALEAQNTHLPQGDEIPSCGEYVEQYLLPLARTDLLYDSIQINERVESISRLGCPPHATVSLAQRSELEFRVLINSQRRGQYSQLADIVLDCSGLTKRIGLAPGGGVAIGETEKHSQAVRRGKQDISGKKRHEFVDRHCLLWGNNLEACANALELARLVAASQTTRVTWAVPKRLVQDQPRFLLPDRKEELFAQVVALESQPPDRFCVMDAWGIEAMRASAADADAKDGKSLQPVALRLQTSAEETLDLDGEVFINCANRLPDWSFAESLMVNGETQRSPECSRRGPNSVTNEPHYYVLGSKACHLSETKLGESHEADPHATAFDQIRETFAIIGGRAELNLYESVKPQST